MRIVLITENFYPLHNSGAVQLRDLAREMTRQGHTLTVLTPTPNLRKSWQIEVSDGFQVLRLKALRTKDIGYLRRTFAEFTMPFIMLRNLRRSPFANVKWDGVVWYSPSIFHGPLANTLKRTSGCKSYLIVRDIFPDWAVDMSLMRKGLAYQFFNAVARYQYSVADFIGVQSPGNQQYFENWSQQRGKSLEVLQNWLGKPAGSRCPIRVSETLLAGRKIFVYAGNMGIAQGMDILLELAQNLKGSTSIGFLFVGRGSEVERLKHLSRIMQLNNTLFFDEIHPDEIPDLYSQCAVGMLALDSRHKSHNIPGKFLTYMQNGLPVLANVNPGNDLINIIRSERVGEICDTSDIKQLVKCVRNILVQIDTDVDLPSRCYQLFKREFSVEKAAQQIVVALNNQ